MNDDPSAKSPRDSSAFDELLARCLERFEAEGSAGLDALCAEHPEQATRLREQVAKLLDMGLLEAPPGASAAASFPERLGPFRLREPLGGGGMGVVFLADQEDLGREVALKLIRPDQLYFPGMRERFRREVEAIAKLEHPGIVPVHAVGEQDGIPYFAMQRVRGASLEALLDRLRGKNPSRLRGRDLADAWAEATRATPEARASITRAFSGGYEECCLRVALQVAEALEHAHGHGVLHRDVKPSNVMITADGRAQLLDFGLATTAGGEALTKSGTPLGSLYYMSPEQGRGAVRDVDRRSDVYSLGVTLYELLTLGPPFTGGSAHEILSRVDQGNPPEPRTRNPALSWECETVVLKAMDRDPPRRYASAAALARDLENVLHHRPIAARRAGAVLRFRRFCRRRPGLAVLLLVGLPAVTIAPSLLLLQERAARREIDEKRAVADRNFARALDAVDAMLSQVAEVDLERVPQMEGVRRALVQKALGFYQQFLAERADDDDVRRRAVRVLQRCGSLHDLLGDYGPSEESYQQALFLLDALRASRGPTEDDAVQAAVCHRSIAASRRSRGLVDDALRATRAAVATLDARREKHPLSNAAEAERAESLLALGVLLLQRDLEEAERTYRTAIDVLERLVEEEPAVARHRSLLARAYKNLGVARDWRGDLDEALALYRRSVEWFEEVLALDETNPALLYDLATGLMNLGAVAIDAGRDGEAELVRSIELLDRLSRDFPTVVRYRMDAVKAGYNLAFGLSKRDDRDDEVRELQAENVRRSRLLVEEYPGAREHVADLARALDGICQFERSRGRLDAAARAGEEAVAVRRREVELFPDSPDARRNLGGILHNLALVVKDRGEPGAAVGLLEEAIREQERALELLPGHAGSRRYLRFHLYALGDARLLSGDVEGALRDADDLVARADDRGRALRGAASLRARAAVAVEGRTPPDGARATALRVTALAELREAIEGGYDDLEALQSDADHEELRRLPGYAEVVAPLVAASAGGGG